MKVEARPRDEGERCPYCRDDLSAVRTRCEDCGAGFHLECARDGLASRCPTPGCQGRPGVSRSQTGPPAGSTEWGGLRCCERAPADEALLLCLGCGRLRHTGCTHDEHPEAKTASIRSAMRGTIRENSSTLTWAGLSCCSEERVGLRGCTACRLLRHARCLSPAGTCCAEGDVVPLGVADGVGVDNPIVISTKPLGFGGYLLIVLMLFLTVALVIAAIAFAPPGAGTAPLPM